MKSLFLPLLAAGAASALSMSNGEIVLFDKAPENESVRKQLDEQLKSAMSFLEKDFDGELESSFLKVLERDLSSLKQSAHYNGYANQPTCGGGSGSSMAPATIRAYPGGASGLSLSFSLSNVISDLASKASGPFNAQGGISNLLAMQAVQTGSMILQGIVADAVHIVPPMIPPPVWNNQPLFCMPMVTGHNCFGAIFHTITTADFVNAAATDSILDGVIASFPQTYEDTVGKTSDSQYKACAAAYFSMQCGSLFPKCVSPQSGNDVTTKAAQRAPMCFTHCIATLVACPGMWLDDIVDQCSDVSVPPMCSNAFFWRLSLVPPQYESSASGVAERGCPSGAAEARLAGAALGGAGGSSGAIGGAGAVNLPTA